MTRLFKRAVSITLSKPTAFFAQSTINQIVISDLRVTFSVVKNLASDPNTCELTITNLSAATRAALQEKPVHVRVDAGYEDQLEQLFVGDMIWSDSFREGSDWITKIQVGDGTRSRSAQTRRSYKSGVDRRTVLTDIAKAAGLKLPSNLKEATELGQQLVSGVTIDGPSDREMTRILAPTGLTHSIQDGKLQIIRAADALGTAVRIAQDTGMIGSPELSAPEKEKGKSILRVRTLLKSKLKAGGQAKIESINHNGIFRIQRVSHDGDTAGPKWESLIEATAL